MASCKLHHSTLKNGIPGILYKILDCKIVFRDSHSLRTVAVAEELGRLYQVRCLGFCSYCMVGVLVAVFLSRELILLFVMITLHPHGSLAVLCMLESTSCTKNIISDK